MPNYWLERHIASYKTSRKAPCPVAIRLRFGADHEWKQTGSGWRGFNAVHSSSSFTASDISRSLPAIFAAMVGVIFGVRWMLHLQPSSSWQLRRNTADPRLHAAWLMRGNHLRCLVISSVLRNCLNV
jgi:hypothetical protein